MEADNDDVAPRLDQATFSFETETDAMLMVA